MALRFIVLAAGKGTRMKSSMPKVLHKLAGKPLLAHVLDTAALLEPQSINVVIGHEAEQIRSAINHSVVWALQTEQLGTGHAVQQGLEGIEDDDTVLITYGDVPLTRANTFQNLIDASGPAAIGLLTLNMEDPTGYGRIMRVNGKITGVVEQKDANSEQLGIKEINAGVMAIHGKWLKEFLSQIGNDNAQGEYYLTDLFALAAAADMSINAVQPADAWEVDGVNSRTQLAAMERQHQANQAYDLMESGVTLADPARIDIRGTLQTGTDVEIDVNCVFIGHCTIGNNVTISANCTLIDCVIDDNAVIHTNSIIESSKVGHGCNIGPFARLRPGTELSSSVRIGNFVETKNAVLGTGSKVNHLSYVGDSDIGSNVNVGAGTITCNYDGANKHKTVIEDNAFIGSNSALVAPVTIKDGATIGAGSTITRVAAANRLTLTRARQMVLEGWQRPVKKSAE